MNELRWDEEKKIETREKALNLLDKIHALSSHLVTVQDEVSSKEKVLAELAETILNLYVFRNGLKTLKEFKEQRGGLSELLLQLKYSEEEAMRSLLLRWIDYAMESINKYVKDHEKASELRRKVLEIHDRLLEEI